MEATINKLIVDINYAEFDLDFTIVKFETTQKYIKFGAKILDNQEIKALSIVFEKGKSFYALFKKGEEKNLRNVDLKDPTISFSNIKSQDLAEYLIVRLLLNSLCNYKNALSYNNLGGAFYKIYEISKNKKSIDVLKVSISSDLLISASATKFIKIDMLAKDYPMYTFSNKNDSFRRVFEYDKEIPIYINKSFKKTEIDFWNIAKKSGKAQVLYEVVNNINSRYSKYINLAFTTIDIKEKKDKLKKDFLDKVIKKYRELPCYILDYSNSEEDEYSFNNIKKSIEKFTGVNIRKSLKINSDGINLVYIHDKDYYGKLSIEDPYKELNINVPIQRFTVENNKCFLKSDGTPAAPLLTILKESIIKHDVLKTHRISFDDWKKYNFKNDWIFGLSKVIRNETQKIIEFYFITIHPDGSFEPQKFENDLFNQDEYALYRKELNDSDGKKILIKDEDNNINIIEQTDMITLPSCDAFTNNVGRNKIDRNEYYAGVVDINYYEIDGDYYYYNVGPLGHGMQSSISKASHLYKINLYENSKNIVYDLLELMGVAFVKYNSFTVLPYPVKYLREYAKIDG